VIGVVHSAAVQQAIPMDGPNLLEQQYEAGCLISQPDYKLEVNAS
jgi:hypothetical protein